MLTYNSETLLGIGYQNKHRKPVRDLIHILKCTGICIFKTTRGCRGKGGLVNNPSKVNVLSSNHNLLVSTNNTSLGAKGKDLKQKVNNPCKTLIKEKISLCVINTRSLRNKTDEL
jgi:hypothetical protein